VWPGLHILHTLARRRRSGAVGPEKFGVLRTNGSERLCRRATARELHGLNARLHGIRLCQPGLVPLSNQLLFDSLPPRRANVSRFPPPCPDRTPNEFRCVRQTRSILPFLQPPASREPRADRVVSRYSGGGSMGIALVMP